MVASGRVSLAEDEADLVDEPPGDYNAEASVNLTDMRDHER